MARVHGVRRPVGIGVDLEGQEVRDVVATDETDRAGTGAQPLGAIATGVAIVLIVVYIVVLFVQWGSVDAAELEWSRRLTLFGGLEALAFAAAGAILGTTVQRQVVKKAEEQATDAKAEANEQKIRADANERDAEKGRALHRLAEVKGTQPSGGPVRRSPGGPPAPDMAELVELARRYDETTGPAT